MPLPEKKTGGAAAAGTTTTTTTKVKSSSGAGGAAAAEGAKLPGKPVETLPCPRCDSMNTKFCYYNNYSVTQPRHFCRQCQRYWTAGGTLRNVPVGGGSRKKNRAYARIEPYSLQHRMGYHAGVAGQPIGAFQPTFGHQLMTPDMAAFAHQNGHAQIHHYVPNHASLNQPGAYAAPGGMIQYATAAPLALHMGPGSGSGLSFELNLAAGESNPTPQGQDSVNTSQGLTVMEQPQSIVPVSTGAPLLAAGSTGAAGQNSKTTTTSPAHGSSTIEEEGSTPTNGYSNNGYEEGDAVSSMWHEMHDMDNVLFQ